MEKILVTGANGYIGSRLIFYLNKKDICPIALIREEAEWPFSLDAEIRRGDFSDEKFLHKSIEDIDIIFHLAGLKEYNKCSEEVDKVVDANISFTGRLLKVARKNKTKVVFTSTYWVYGHKSPVPYDENLVLMPSEPYGWSKAMAEKMIMTSGVEYNILRLSNVFGYGMGKGYDEVVSLFLKKAISGEPVLLHNSGKHNIDLISIDDTCRVLVSIIKKDFKDLILNVGSGIPISILKLAEVVNEVSKRLTGNSASISNEKTENNDILFSDRWVDISRLKKLTGFVPTPIVSSMERFSHNLLAESSIT
jgi:nucleoside-diphosphate-sugar epimerase